MKRLALLAFSLVLCLVLAELVLRAFTPYPVHGASANRDPHDVLGYVLDPTLADSDAAGFRNPADVTGVELVTLGDSHTFGFNVARPENWPSRLAEREGLSVYNYGMGGYGVLQYWWLFQRALERSPETILLGLYPANDVADHCPLSDSTYWKAELARLGAENVACTSEERRRAASAPDAGEKNPPLWQRSALGSATRDVWRRWLSPLRNPDDYVWFRDGGRATSVSKDQIQRHSRNTDLASPQIRAAYETTRLLLEGMAEEARERRVRFAVLFIPSKENVLFETADPADAFHAKLSEAVRRERRLTRDLEAFLRERDVRTADALGSLQRDEGPPLYPRAAGGHPLAAGYARYAAAAGDLLRD